MSRDCFIVAIDGPSGAGKSTTSRRVADRLGLGYVDSGALYRAVGLAALRSGVDLEDAAALGRLVADVDIDVGERCDVIRLDGRDVTSVIRTAEVSSAASKVSACAPVRAALIALQRDAARPPGAVVEGRDIGTVIFPDADLKVFLDADPDERARRRTAEMESRTDVAKFETVKRDMAERDRRDTTRRIAPLEVAADAIVIDSTHLALDAVVDRIVKEASGRLARN